jgi:peptide/nickel transport system substrate-binding protein
MGLKREGIAIAVLVGILVVVLNFAVMASSVKNPDSLVILRPADIVTLDPQWECDGQSHEMMYNIFDKLIWLKGESLIEFEPYLSTEVPSMDNGLMRIGGDGALYIDFPIREGVVFHKVGVQQPDGTVVWKDYDSLTGEERQSIAPGYGQLTAEDVKYSLLRGLIMDRSGSVISDFMKLVAGGITSIVKLAESIAGVEDFSQISEAQAVETFEFLDRAIAVKEGVVELRFPIPAASSLMSFVTFLNNFIVDKEWTVAQGEWPGTAETWPDYHDPAVGDTNLYQQANGTGPFKVVSWDRGEKVLTLARFENYWKGPAGVEKLVRKTVPEWTTRKLMLQNGDADIIQADLSYLPQLSGMEGVRVQGGLPSIGYQNPWFNYNVGPDSPAIGSGKLDGKGIPADFFSDVNVRKAFCYAFDYQTYIDQVWGGQAVQVKGPILRGSLGYSPDQPQYVYDPQKAAEYFKKAFDGKLWEVGFEFTAYTADRYPEGFKMCLNVLQQCLLTINPKFKMETQELAWSTFLGMISGDRSMPLFTMWKSPQPDPDSMASHFMSSTGPTPQYLGDDYVSMCEENFDALIAEAAQTFDTTARAEIYDELQRLAYEHAIQLFVIQPVANLVSRDWVNGLYWNPLRGYMMIYWGVTKG